MQRVDSGFRHDAHLPAGPPPIFDRVGVGQKVELAHCVDAQQILADSAGRVRKLAGAAELNAVQQEHVL